MDKLHEYQGLTGRFHNFRDIVKEKFANYKDAQHLVTVAKTTANDQLKGNASADQDFSHIYR